METLQELGIQIIQAIQVLMPTLDTMMEIFTFLGKIEFYMLFITFIYWIVDASLGFRVFMVLLATDLVGMAFKHLLHQPRPYWIGDVQHIGGEESLTGFHLHMQVILSRYGVISLIRVESLGCGSPRSS